jgi:hypothetical protein
VPGLPHHVTQRGNRRQPTFFCADDYAAYVGGIPGTRTDIDGQIPGTRTDIDTLGKIRRGRKRGHH